MDDYAKKLEDMAKLLESDEDCKKSDVAMAIASGIRSALEIYEMPIWKERIFKQRDAAIARQARMDELASLLERLPKDTQFWFNDWIKDRIKQLSSEAGKAGQEPPSQNDVLSTAPKEKVASGDVPPSPPAPEASSDPQIIANVLDAESKAMATMVSFADFSDDKIEFSRHNVLAFYVGKLHERADEYRLRVASKNTVVPPAPEASEIRPEIMRFARAMEQKMAQNDAKKGNSWKKMKESQLYNLMAHEVQEYLDFHDANEFVDVANFAMMIWNNEVYQPFDDRPPKPPTGPAPSVKAGEDAPPEKETSERLAAIFEPCATCGIEHWQHAENEWEVKHHFKPADDSAGALGSSTSIENSVESPRQSFESANPAPSKDEAIEKLAEEFYEKDRAENGEFGKGWDKYQNLERDITQRYRDAARWALSSPALEAEAAARPEVIELVVKEMTKKRRGEGGMSYFARIAIGGPKEMAKMPEVQTLCDEQLVEGLAEFEHNDNEKGMEDHTPRKWEERGEVEKNYWRNDIRAALKYAREKLRSKSAERK